MLGYTVHSVVYTCDLILARILLLGLCPFINRVLQSVTANEEQADTVDVLDVNTSSNRTIALEPPNASSSEQVTLQKPILNQPIAS